MAMEVKLIALIMPLIAVICSTGAGVVAAVSPQFTAIFAFGDSLSDPGNNNYLNSLAKANYVPYGVDFYQGPSGRFCNGKTAVDYLGDMLGMPLLPAYTTTFAAGRNILKGVNYASAAGGILEETGQNLGERFSLSGQVENFESTLNQLRRQMEDEELSNYLAKALAIMALGSNDYINNYLSPNFYTSSYFYTPKDYADLLINRYTRQILALHSLGFRKFLLAGIGPLGCIPNQLATGLPPPGKCVAYTNDVVGMFNNRLVSLVDQLNSNYNGSIFAYGNTFGAVMDIINNAKTYGFSVTDRGCCGIGRNRGQITCLPFSMPCSNRNQYVFWDAFHPTQAVNQILARRAYSGTPSDCYPVNVQQMALM
ncbi:GDSL esterase/lipase At5g08460-like [Sesamum indicum]|uniref:GDSL esterase/lipase At5g08460-like n=1 Tax=Sesamum indicum TaxID=4182 RepID=A0A6I9TJK1_SESIN|nr:GDSL esterase/lipase At5g08460-like [Sesamum indicum]